MLDVVKLIKEALFFEEEGYLEKDLVEGEVFLGSDMYSRALKDKVTLYYLNSSDQIEIPKEYLNLFQILQRREGDRLRGNICGEDLDTFLRLGIELPGILLYQERPKSASRNIICQMTLIGTSKVRQVIPEMRPWTLSNINSTLEV